MEDTYYLDTDFAGRGWVFGGVYDGHGGDYAARYAAQTLHHLFLGKYLSGASPGKAFTESYEAVSDALAVQESGTTAASFFIRGSDIFTANVGDSRITVFNSSGYQQLSVDHRLSNREELDRIKAAGAMISYPYVMRSRQGIMTTRALGDPYFKPAGVISIPSLNHHVISGDDLWLLAASDGLWDVMTHGEISAFVKEYTDPGKLVEALAREVMENRLGADNLTIIALSFTS